MAGVIVVVDKYLHDSCDLDRLNLVVRHWNSKMVLWGTTYFHCCWLLVINYCLTQFIEHKLPVNWTNPVYEEKEVLHAVINKVYGSVIARTSFPVVQNLTVIFWFVQMNSIATCSGSEEELLTWFLQDHGEFHTYIKAIICVPLNSTYTIDLWKATLHLCRLS